MLTEAAVLSLVKELEAEDLRHWIDRGWVRPEPAEGAWLFEEIDVARVRLVWLLRREWLMETDAIDLVLSLLDQLHATRRVLRGR